MSKKIKMDLKDLKVQSFVTSLDEEEKSQLKGGLPNTCVTCDLECSFSRWMDCMTEYLSCFQTCMYHCP